MKKNKNKWIYFFLNGRRKISSFMRGMKKKNNSSNLILFCVLGGILNAKHNNIDEYGTVYCRQF